MTDSKDKSNDGSASISHIGGSGELMPQIQEDTTQDIFLDMEPIKALKEGKTIRVPKNPHFTRKDVVQSFQSAFELVGGVPRLALWAHENYTDFAKLYARLLPSQSSSALGEANVLRIELAVKPGPLDEVS